jgi:acetyltransferase EpsM
MSSPEMNHYIIVGAGGHGAVIAEIIEELQLKVECFVDKKTFNNGVCGYPVLLEELLLDVDSANFVIGIGDNKVRKQIVLSKSRKYGKAIHPAASISKRAQLGAGTVVMAGACINANVHLGEHCIVNTNATIDHDCRLGDYVHVAPAVALAGNVTVGEGTLIGIGAVVIPGITIGKWAIVGAGAAVINDVPDFSIVAGVPAKSIGTND